MSKFIKHTTEYILFQVIGFLIRLLPLHLVHNTGCVFGRLFYPVLKSRKDVALKNLRNAFPEMESSRREEIALRSFQSVCTAFMELLWFPMLTKDGMKKRVKIENPELLDQLLNEKKGIIFLTAHFGNWELAVQSISAYTNASVYAIAKKQSNRRVDKLITAWRQKFGVKIIPMETSIRETLRILQQGGIIELAADQAAPKESVWVEFFGRKVPTFQGPAVFCLKTGAPIVLGCTVRQEDGNYSMRLVHVSSDDINGSSEKKIFELTQRHVQMTEEIIRQYPEQWMWMHKRWKHVLDRVEAAE